MRIKNVFRRLLAAAACIVLPLTAASCGGSAKEKNINIRLTLNNMPVNVDPQLASTPEELTIVRNSFEGLFRVDSGKIVKAACESYKVSDDGLTYIFTLRKGLKWSDGTDLTADDFRFGLRRALRPETLSPDAQRLFCIKNAEKVYSGSADEAELGVTSDGSRRLTINLEHKDDGLPEALTLALAMPCNEKTFSDAAGRYAMSSELTLCNGPFALSYWDKTNIKLTRNSNYSGKFRSVPSQVVFSFGGTDTERINNINSDFCDIAQIESQSADAAAGALLNISAVNDTAWILVINPKSKVVGDDAVSAALKKALGADIYSSSLSSGFSAINGIIADDVLVSEGRYTDSVSHEQLAESDNAAAKNMLISALKPYKGNLPAITIKYAENPTLKQAVTRIAQNWQQELGAVVNIEQSSETDLETAMRDGNYQIALCPIRPADGKAISVLGRFSSTDDNNIYGYADSKTDKMIAALDGSAESAFAVEQRIISSSRICPVAQSGTYYAMKKSVTGLKADIYQGHLSLYGVSK